MTLRKFLLSGSIVGAAAASLMTVSAARADVIATIVGAYDLHAYDSPELIFTNLSDGALTNIQMTLTGYQGLNNGVTTTFGLADMAAGSTTNVIWGSIPGVNGGTTPGNLTAYDYDDEWGNTPAGYTNGDCVVGGSLCAVVGNFSV
jgi:hypothetical protein